MSATSCTAEVAERVKLQKHICSSSADEVNEIKARLHIVFSSEMPPNTGQGDYSPTSVHKHTGISIKITLAFALITIRIPTLSPSNSINPHISKLKSLFNFGVIFIIHVYFQILLSLFSPPPSINVNQEGLLVLC